MAKVYARDPGAEIRVGNYGVATEAVPVEVPADVAQELVAFNAAVRVETEDPAPRPSRKAPKEKED